MPAGLPAPVGCAAAGRGCRDADALPGLLLACVRFKQVRCCALACLAASNRWWRCRRARLLALYKHLHVHV